MLPLDSGISAQIGILQSLDDAIAFRFGRLQRPCLDCTSRHRCTEHAFDAHLLEVYKARYAAASAGVLAEMSPDDIGQLTRAGGAAPAAAILRAAVAARLRKAATASPVVVELDGQPVVIELDGQALAGYSLLPAG